VVFARRGATLLLQAGAQAGRAGDRMALVLVAQNDPVCSFLATGSRFRNFIGTVEFQELRQRQPCRKCRKNEVFPGILALPSGADPQFSFDFDIRFQSLKNLAWIDVERFVERFCV
jgi:hypothetical protein